MSKGQTHPTAAVAIPTWQLMLVLVGLPALYMANSLLPSAVGLFHPARRWCCVTRLLFHARHLGVGTVAVSHAYLVGLLFSALFLWRQSVVPGVCLHALIDVANISG